MSEIVVGQRVVYANGLYEVAQVNGDTLTLDGLSWIYYEPGAGYRGDYRPRITVLTGDVAPVARKDVAP